MFAVALASCAGDKTEPLAPEPHGLPDHARSFVLNETMIEDLGTGSVEDACHPSVVLPGLLAQIGPAADIYPSENYYYFSFAHGGSLFSGSIRLSSDRRDTGELDYVCYQSYRRWTQPGGEIRVHQRLNAADGVDVARLSENSYSVSVGGEQTVFALHQLDHERGGAALLEGDTRIGRTLDESGTSFELIYNEQLNEMYFMLDQEGSAPDTLTRYAPNTVISRRTGFVYYHQSPGNRYVLVAVNGLEADLNSWFDGPFDHLPENDYAKIGFWDYVYKVWPGLIGNHTPGGTVGDEGMIFSIRPYRLYRELSALGFVETCAANRATDIDVLSCMIWGP